MNVGIVGAVFGLVFLAELPDKTALASLVLGTRYRPAFVFPGVAAAFAVHACLAVAAGSLLSLLPRRPVEAIVGAIFLAGAVILLRPRGPRDGDAEQAEVSEAPAVSFTRVAAASFAVIMVAEFGDITQVLTASLAAKYHSPASVLTGSILGLWAAAAVAISGGRGLMRLVSVRVITRLVALVMAALGIVSLAAAVAG